MGSTLGTGTAFDFPLGGDGYGSDAIPLGVVRDLLLDSETGDLAVANGDLQLAFGPPAVLQGARLRMGFFRGEWFLNELRGLPYYQRIFIKSPNLAEVRNYFRGALLATPDITEVSAIAIATLSTRLAKAAFKAVSNVGEIGSAYEALSVPQTFTSSGDPLPSNPLPTILATAPQLARDLLLDADGDLVIANGDLQIVKGEAATTQGATLRVGFVRGEWFLNEERGIPYYERIFIKSPNVNEIREYFRKAILATPDVVKMLAIAVSNIDANRKSTVTFKADSTFGVLKGQI